MIKYKTRSGKAERFRYKDMRQVKKSITIDGEGTVFGRQVPGLDRFTQKYMKDKFTLVSERVEEGASLKTPQQKAEEAKSQVAELKSMVEKPKEEPKVEKEENKEEEVSKEEEKSDSDDIKARAKAVMGNRKKRG